MTPTLETLNPMAAPQNRPQRYPGWAALLLLAPCLLVAALGSGCDPQDTGLPPGNTNQPLGNEPETPTPIAFDERCQGFSVLPAAHALADSEAVAQGRLVHIAWDAAVTDSLALPASYFAAARIDVPAVGSGPSPVVSATETSLDLVIPAGAWPAAEGTVSFRLLLGDPSGLTECASPGATSYAIDAELTIDASGQIVDSFFIH